MTHKITDSDLADYATPIKIVLASSSKEMKSLYTKIDLLSDKKDSYYVKGHKEEKFDRLDKAIEAYNNI